MGINLLAIFIAVLSALQFRVARRDNMKTSNSLTV